MTLEEVINNQIQNPAVDKNKISDGYHTFGELYEHRIALYISLCSLLQAEAIREYDDLAVWRSKLHSDGSSIDGWFIMGIAKGRTHQITYHLPISKWEECNFAETLELAPEYDGHTSKDVLERLKFIK